MGFARPALLALVLALCGSAAAVTSVADRCYGDWFRCVKSPACRAQMLSVQRCFFNPALAQSGAGACVAAAYSTTQHVPELLSLTNCAKRLIGKDWVTLDTSIDIPGVMPAQIWPFLEDLTKYPRWTNNVYATCASPGCDPTKPLPGDLLNVRVQLFPGTRIPPALIPWAQVTEVRNGTGCIGLAGRCQNTSQEPRYRIAWGPTFVPGPLEVWGYEHFFDLLDLKDSSGTVIGTTLHHWEYYKGALAPLVMSDRYGFKVKSFLSTTVSRQNNDMKAFALGTFGYMPATAPVPKI